MAINMDAANAQAGQLSANTNQLQDAKRQMQFYKDSIIANWQGREIAYIIQGIDKAIAQIDNIIRQLGSLNADIVNTAAAIKREEEAAAAAARARAERDRHIRDAQNAYNQSVEELDLLNKEKQRLLDSMNERKSIKPDIEKMHQLGELVKRIEDAERKRNDCQNILSAARR